MNFVEKNVRRNECNEKYCECFLGGRKNLDALRTFGLQIRVIAENILNNRQKWFSVLGFVRGATKI